MKNSNIGAPGFRNAGRELSPEAESFLLEGFDLFCDPPFADRPEEMRELWKAHRRRITRLAECEHGPGSKPWAFHAFEFGAKHEREVFAGLYRNRTLSEEQMAAVRARHAEGETPEEISSGFGIPLAQVRAILGAAQQQKSEDGV